MRKYEFINLFEKKKIHISRLLEEARANCQKCRHTYSSYRPVVDPDSTDEGSAEWEVV